MFKTMSELVDWLRKRVRREGWSYNELARRAGLSSGGISIVMTQRQNAGVEFCLGVARALNEPPEKIFRLAGLLPRRSGTDEKIDEIVFYFDQMTPQAQEHFRQIARALAEAQTLSGAQALSRGGERVETDGDEDTSPATGQALAPA
jgi:transcriptional regulator with XRE-family HTH domain